MDSFFVIISLNDKTHVKHQTVPKDTILSCYYFRVGIWKYHYRFGSYCKFIRLLSSNDECISALDCAEQISYRFQNNLYLNKNHIGKKTVVKINLDDRANIEQVTIVENSADEQFERAVIDAVTMTFPYEALLELPENEYEKIKTIKLTVIPQSD